MISAPGLTSTAGVAPIKTVLANSGFSPPTPVPIAPENAAPLARTELVDAVDDASGRLINLVALDRDRGGAGDGAEHRVDLNAHRVPTAQDLRRHEYSACRRFH